MALPMNRRALLGGLFAAASVPALAACSGGITSLDEGSGASGGGSGSSAGGLTIGTANFTENQVLGEAVRDAVVAGPLVAAGQPGAEILEEFVHVRLAASSTG